MLKYPRKIWNWFRLEVYAIPWKMITFVFLVFLILFPLITTNSYILRIMTFACIFAIFSSSWDLLAGYLGLLNLGHTAFFGVGAYTAALLNKHLGFGPLFSIPCGAVMAVLAGLIIALPTMRLRGLYLSLVTLAYPMVLSGLIYIFPDFTGAELGIFGLSRMSFSPVVNYYIVLPVMIVSLLVMWKFTDTTSRFVRTGVIFHAVHEDEISARASGINTTFYKSIGFCISGFFAGLAGGLYAHFMTIADPSTLELMFSFDAILWACLGGLNTIYGAVAGVFFLYPLVEFLRLNELGDDIRIIFKALILMAVLLFMPEGFTTWIRDHIEINCPRCKIANLWTRNNCRACRANLRRDMHV
ncbi:branched-chain amino acid ABC transporter permease [Thermodesulfobacteriota bacterium]